MNKNRLTAPLSESLVLGALTHNLDWMEEQGVALKGSDFVLINSQVLYSIMRDRFLEQNLEITSEQLFTEAKKHPQSNTVDLEYCKNIRDKVGNNISLETFKKEVLRLNKLRVLRELADEGFDVDAIIGEDSIQAPSPIAVIDEMSMEEILNFYRSKVDFIEASVESIKGKTSINAADGLRDLIAELKDTPQVGALLDGDYFNSVVRGALFGKYYINSAPSGVGKTRIKLGNAAKLAFPRILEDGTVEYNQDGYSPVLFVTTELSPEEIQTMLAAAVSGVEEERIKESNLSFNELERLDLAIDIIENSNHFFIEQIADPTNTSVKSTIERHIRRNGVEYIFFDYIFGSPGINSEFGNRREDVLLMYLSNTLKDIASIYNVFIMTSTQVNGSWAEAEFRNQNLIRGSKAIADKADVGMITVDVTSEERMKIEPIVNALGCESPTIVTDIYKNRGGRYTAIKIYRYFDKGTCRMKDLFMTTQDYEVIEVGRFYEANTMRFTYEQTREVWDNESNRIKGES